MNVEYDQFKKQYDEVSKEIMILHEKQRGILKQMKLACTHPNLIKSMPDDYLIEIGVEDSDDVKHKCMDCYCYVDAAEVAAIRAKKTEGAASHEG